jgi:endonuclease YncB( thermonuclease family)
MRRRVFVGLVLLMTVIGSTGESGAKWPNGWQAVQSDMPVEVPEPSTGRLGCWDFPVQTDAQAVLNALPHDPFGLDPDYNGAACDDDPLLIAYQGGYSAFVAAWEPDYYPPSDPTEYELLGATQDYYGLSVAYDENPNFHLRSMSVYLLGVNVPAMANPADGTPDACFAGQAEAFAVQQLGITEMVTVEWDEDPQLPNGDPAAYIWYDDASGDSILLNEELLRNGLVVYAGIDHLDRYASRLQAAQNEAIAGRVGLWGSC